MQIPTHYPHLFHFESNYTACLYLASLDLNLLESYATYLCHEEQIYFKTLKHEKRQLSYLLGRYCAKQALATYTKYPVSADWHIAPGIFNQPVIVANPTNLNLSLSLSHSYNYGAALVFPTTYPMAVDLEIIDVQRQKIIHAKCSPRERELVNSPSEYFLLWTAKEVLAKVLKTGLGASFKIYEVAEVKDCGQYYESDYVYFSQYRCISWVWGEVLISMVKPNDIALLKQSPSIIPCDTESSSAG